MAISKIILNGVTQMDVTGKTVTAGDMLSGVTALKNDGTDITGNIAAMTLPSASSSTSSGTSKATITPTSSAQYLNIPAGHLDTAQYYTIAAASGGASNIVTGTFKGTTTDAAMDVTLNYTGSGYPIAIFIGVDGGNYGNSSFYSLVHRYGITIWSCYKCDTSGAPNYSGDQDYSKDRVIVNSEYKSSSSNSSNYSAVGNSNSLVFNDTNATSVAAANCVRIRSKTKMSVYIGSPSNYGFVANYDYRYWVIYSS